MKIATYVVILLSALLIGSCKREVIPPLPSNAPIFGVEGKLGEDSIALVAGIDEVMMQPSVEHSNGINIYSGLLGTDKSSFKIEIYNGDLDYPNQPKFEINSIKSTSFTPTYQGYLWVISMSSLPSYGSVIGVKWFVDGVLQPATDQLKINLPGKYNVCATVQYASMLESTLCSEVIVGFKKNADFEMGFEVELGSKLKGSIIEPSGPYSKVQWFLNNNLISTQASIDTLLPSDKYLLRSEVTFVNGVLVKHESLVDVSYDGNHIPDLNSISELTNKLWDYKARITLVKDGKTFTSDNEYNGNRFIVIDKLEKYGTDAKGNPVYMITGTIDVLLEGQDSAVLPLKAKMQLAISVK